MPQKLPNLVNSTAGAVPILNEKGELTMQKVKVTRYVSGRRPEYAPSDSESESSEEEGEGFVGGVGEGVEEVEEVEEEEDVGVDDRRLQRLRERQSIPSRGRRLIQDPEVIYDAEAESDDSDDSDDEELYPMDNEEERLASHRLAAPPSSSESEEEEFDEEAIERRREMMRERARLRNMEEDVLDVAEEVGSGSEGESSSEYEDYTDSEDDTGPRLKPVFVRKVDRVTIKDQGEVDKQTAELEKDKKKAAELRKKESHRLVEAAVKEELAVEQGVGSTDAVVITDDENDEMEYEAWKLRELKRIKRDREEVERIEKDREEIERLRNMTEEERKAALRNQPKKVTNAMEKGKYKFLQKYYHRGAFYLDEEENVFKRDIAQPTLEDHFDKTVLPKVMQVKNFGRAGRTKYTHLVDQDTTEMDNAWSQITPVNLKFQNMGGGTKQNFEKPSYKKRKLA